MLAEMVWNSFGVALGDEARSEGAVLRKGEGAKRDVLVHEVTVWRPGGEVFVLDVYEARFVDCEDF